LDGEIGELSKQVEPQRDNLPPELQEKLNELEDSVVLARQFTSSNKMDFRRVELGLAQLRTLKAEIVTSLNEFKI
jgi:hypothetical protein